MVANPPVDAGALYADLAQTQRNIAACADRRAQLMQSVIAAEHALETIDNATTAGSPLLEGRYYSSTQAAVTAIEVLLSTLRTEVRSQEAERARQHDVAQGIRRTLALAG